MNKLIVITMLLFSVSSFADKTVEIEVTSKGYVPSRFEVNANEKVTLKVTRKTKITCAKEIEIPSLNISKKLPLNKTVTFDITPSKAGEVVFGCHMKQMLGGVMVVK